MNVELVKEYEDGSATYTFDMSDEERDSLMRFAIIEALKKGIEEGNKYTPPESEDESNDGLENT
jgi:hypothetical protein